MATSQSQDIVQKILIDLSYYNYLKHGIITEEQESAAKIKILIDVTELNFLIQSRLNAENTGPVRRTPINHPYYRQ